MTTFFQNRSDSSRQFFQTQLTLLYQKPVLLLLLSLLLGLAPGAQAQRRAGLPFFQADTQAAARAAGSPLAAALLRAEALTVDVEALGTALALAPAGPTSGAAFVLALPLPNGLTGRFALHETSVMAPALAARFPTIRTYAGSGLDDSRASVRLDLTPQGFHAQVLTSGGNSFYIDPVSPSDSRHYLGYYQRDMNRAAAGADRYCDFRPTAADEQATTARRAAPAARSLTSGSLLRTYRLALACTPEYALTKGNTVTGVLAAEVTTINRVVGVYERELAVTLVLVANNDQLIFLSGTGTQPAPAYTNSSGTAMLSQNQANVDRLIGSANYDIGHVVSTGGGGIAYLGVVGSLYLKAGGVTGSPNPVGDAFDIDYVAHEMGHQFAGTHSFNGNAGACTGTNRNASTAWEPGSGSTIMAYAGICGTANNLQAHSDPTFHTGSYEQMRAFIASTTCGTSQGTDNTAPVVTVPAGGRTLPIGTPFQLTASATDAENDPLTYSWEELDLGAAGTPTSAQLINQNEPLFRSFNPTTTGTRYFPRLSELIANTTLIGEQLPTMTRTLSFRCTARDEHSGAAGVVGGVSFSAPVSLSVTSLAGPFVVTAPTTPVSWTGGAAQLITWNVANTAAAPVNCARVNLRLSLDGGLTYPTALALDQPNNGTAVVLLPSPATTQTQARVLVEAADNYFFAISSVNFTITPPAVGPTISGFTPGGGMPGTVVTVFGSNFTAATAVLFNGLPAVGFTVSSATQLTVTVPAGVTTGPITIATATGPTSSDHAFSVGPAAVVSSFLPLAGPVGARVVLTGTAFTGATQVSFNGTVAPGFVVNSPTQLTVTVPNGTLTGLIAVTTAISTVFSAKSFGVIPPPVITSFAPTLSSPGTVVVLTGTAFTDATQIVFNGANAPDFTVNSSTQVSVSVPANATSGPITVLTPGGTGNSLTSFFILAPNNQCAQALPLACGQILTGSTVGASTGGDRPPTCTETVDAGGLFYTLVGSGTAMTVSTCNAGTTFDTKLFVYSGSCGAYTCVGGNDDDPNCSTIGNPYASTLTFASVAGVIYHVFVSGYQGSAGTFVLSASSTTPGDLVIGAGSLISPMLVLAGTYRTLTITANGVGQLVGDVEVNTAVTIQSGGVLLTNAQSLTGSASFTLAAGAGLIIGHPLGLSLSGPGAVQTTGPRTFSPEASYSYGAAGAQVTGAGLPGLVRNLTTLGAGALTLSAPVAIAQVLQVAGTGDLLLNGQALTLLSSAAGTALVVNSSTGLVRGATSTVQRYLDPSQNPGPGYRHYSAPVSGATVASLSTAGFIPEVSQAQTYNTSATPGTTSPFPTVFGYDQSRVTALTTNLSSLDQGFVVPAGLSAPLRVGQGYVVNLDAAQLVAFTGELTSGDQTQTLTRTDGPQPGSSDAGWQLVGNPYPAPLDFGLLTAADRPNLDAAMYVFESSGPYAGAYRTYVNGVGASSLIGSSQGFFVRVSSGQTSGALTFRNRQRLTGYADQVPVRRAAADTRPLVQLALRSPKGATDTFYAYAETGATADFNPQLEAQKMPNSTGLNLASQRGPGQPLTIDARPAFTLGTVVALAIAVPGAGTYTLTAPVAQNLPAGLALYLHDAGTDQTGPLGPAPGYTFSVSAAQASAGLAGRFSLRFGPGALLASSPALVAGAVTIFPNPAHARFTVLVPDGTGRLPAELLNSLGQVVRRLTAPGPRLVVETDGLAPGVYTLCLRGGSAVITRRVVLE